MRWTWQVVTVLVATLPGLLCPWEADGQTPEVRATEGWLLPAAAGATSQAGLTIQNDTSYVVYVTSAMTDAAGRVELRDARKPDQAVQFITVPAFGSVTMEPDGPHLMLFDLKRPLVAGDTVAVTLQSDAGVDIPGNLSVQTP